MATSFKKFHSQRSKILQISGTKQSLFNNQLLISSGVPSLDNILGGGIAVGSVILIEEDPFGQYAKLLLRYFLAESVMTHQPLFLATVGNQLTNILKGLPQPVLDKSDNSQVPCDIQSEQMKIAWRYQHQNKFESNPTGVEFGHYYDLTQCMSEEQINTIDTTLVDINQLVDPLQLQYSHEKIETKQGVYENLLQRIQAAIKKGQFRTKDKPTKRNILRIALHSVGSPLWGDLLTCGQGSLSHDIHLQAALPRFFIALRSILRSSFAVAMITVPSHIFHDPTFVHRIERLCDTVVQIERFTDSQKAINPLYKDYHGLLHIKQLPKLNSIKCQMPDVMDWAFKLRRKKLVIEKLHLPPDFSGSGSQSESHQASSGDKMIGCSGTTKSHLEF